MFYEKPLLKATLDVFKLGNRCIGADLLELEGLELPQYFGQRAHAIDEPLIIKTNN
jgi:hypothetical protein